MKKMLAVTASTAATALVAAGCGGSAGAAGGETYAWDFTVTTSDASTWYQGAEKFGELLEEASDGRMTLNIFANEQLSGGDPAAGVEQLADGSKAFSYNSPIIYSGIDQRFSVINAPFLYADEAAVDPVLAGEGQDVYTELLDEMGITFLGFGESGFRQLTTSDREVRTPEDLEGLKIRVAGSSLFLDFYAQYGADPTAMNFAEVFTSLQTGTIDGQENPFDTIASSGLDEVQNHATAWNYVYDPLLLGMNAQMFDELSPEDQEIVTTAAAEANAFQVELNRQISDEQRASLEENMAIIDLTPEELEAFRDSSEPIYEKYADIWTEENVSRLAPADG